MKRARLTRYIHLGIEALVMHKMRSMLTMLGVIFGVGSVIAMLSVGEGASASALEQIRKLGSNVIMVNALKPSADAMSASRGRVHMNIYGLTYDDEQRIRETMPNVRQTVPVKLLRREARLGERSLEVRIVGTTEEWFTLVRRKLIAGRILRARDVVDRAAVVVLTEHAARKLLATEGVLGESIRVGGVAYEIVGIVQSEGGSVGTLETPDRLVDAYIPLTTVQDRFGEVDIRRSSGSSERELVELHQIIVEVTELEHVERLAETISHMLSRFHAREDYVLNVPLTLLRRAEETKRTFNVVLGSIAGISLLVGGIGIMNIMLASVTERTREIGIRRAVGARRKQIIAQFLTETVVLSTAGGLIGIVIGVAIPRAITVFAGMPTIVTPWSVFLSLGISVGVGVVFGLYPAIRAARLDPITALRHE